MKNLPAITLKLAKWTLIFGLFAIIPIAIVEVGPTLNRGQSKTVTVSKNDSKIKMEVLSIDGCDYVVTKFLNHIDVLHSNSCKNCVGMKNK